MGFFDYINTVLSKCYEQSPLRRLLSLFNLTSTATTDATTSSPHISNFTSGIVGMSLAGAAIFGPIGLVIGGIIASLLLFGMKTLHNGTASIAISQIARRLVSSFKSTNYMALGIICAIISFICFILGDKPEIAVGGILGELIAYETFDWLLKLLEPVFPYLSPIRDILKHVYDVRSVVLGLISTLSGFLTYEREKVLQNLGAVYEKMCPTVQHIVECSKSSNFVTNSKALALLGLNGFIIYRIFKWKQVTNLRTLRAVKIATIAIGICLGVDSIILGISNEQTVREFVQDLPERLHFDELEESPNIVLSTEIVALLCLNSFVMWWAYEWMKATNLVIFQDFDSTIIGIGICLGVDAIVIGTVKRNTLWQLIRTTPEYSHLVAKYFVSFVKSKWFAVGAVVYSTIGLFCVLYHFSDEIGHSCNLFIESCSHKTQIAFNRIRQSMSKIKNDLITKTGKIYLSATSILSELYEQYHENPVIVSALSMLNSREFMKSTLVFFGLGIIGLLLLGLKGIIIGFIIAGLIHLAISQCPRGSTALGDAICEKLGLRPKRTHSFNIFGSVYKFDLPQEDVSSIEQWEEHKKSEVCRSLLSFVLNDMKYKVSGMHVEFRRSNDPQQCRVVEPLVSSVYDRDNTDVETEAMDEVFYPDERICEVETMDFCQQTDDNGDYRVAGSNDPNKQVYKSSIISTVLPSK